MDYQGSGKPYPENEPMLFSQELYNRDRPKWMLHRIYFQHLKACAEHIKRLDIQSQSATRLLERVRMVDHPHFWHWIYYYLK